MKQTAVDWLVKKLNQKIDFIPMHKWDEIADIVSQSKAMEKEQIVEAYVEGVSDEGRKTIHTRTNAEQYYEDTFQGVDD